MRFRPIPVVLFLFAAILSARTIVAASAQTEIGGVQAAISGPQRTRANVTRDRFRHPLGTLRFFGIRSDMTVVEVLPGTGWYTEILAPLLREKGHLIEALPPVSKAARIPSKLTPKFQAKLAAAPEVYGKVETIPFAPPTAFDLGRSDSADMILTFRNMHDLLYANVHGTISDTAALRFFQSAYRTLKRGGVLGIVAHRAPSDMAEKQSFKLGRLPQAYVVKLAKTAGFHLVASSEVNANPDDPGNVPVWYLPPMLSKASGDLKKYENIGEGDNMTLKFVKPVDD